MNNNKLNSSENELNSSINLRTFLNALKRESKLIVVLMTLSTIASSIYSLNIKPIYLGNFNIVVKKEDKNISNIGMILPPSLSRITKRQENETQRLILKSPLVLLPVYEYVQNYNLNRGIENKNITFKKWVKELDINYRNDSSVLEVSYKSDDKNLILNTLKMISSKYKSYSKRDTEKYLTKTINYLEDQKNIMSKKSEISQKAFNKFSIDNGLGNIDGFVDLDDSINPKMNESLKLKNSVETRQRFGNQFARLEKFEADLVEYSSKLKPNSNYLKDLNRKINNLRASLRRPNEILLEYKTLKNKAIRDEKILYKIEENLELSKLQKIINPDPWELISVPSVEKFPVYPNKKNIVAISIIISGILSSFLVIIKNYLSGIIYDKGFFKNNLPYQFIETLYKGDNELNSVIISKSLKIEPSDKIGIVFFSKEFFLDNPKFEIDLSKKELDFEFLNINSIKISKLEKIILIAEPGKINFQEFLKINQYLLVLKEKVKGYFLINNDIS